MDEDTANDMMWEDQENYRAGGGNSIKEIVLDRYKTCLVEGAKEMTRGGVIKRVLNGQLIEFPKPDQIQLFTNSVEMLLISLKAHAEQHADVMRPYLYRYYKGKRDIAQIRESKRQELISAVTPGRTYSSYERQATISSQVTRIDTMLSDWYDKEYLRLHKDLLVGLSMLLNKVNYFEEIDMSWAVDGSGPETVEVEDRLNEEALLDGPKPSA